MAHCIYFAAWLRRRAEALEDAGRLEEAQEASDEALNRLGQMDRQLSRRAMRLSLVALAAEEGTVAAIDRSRKQLRMLDVHEEDRHALEQELDELESGLLEGFEESHAPEASANTGSNQKGGTSARGSNEMDWLRTLGQQQQSSGAQQGQQRAGAGSAGQQQGGARPVVLQQGTGGPQITLTPPDGNNQQQAAALQQLNQAAQQVRQQQQQHGQQQQQQSQQPQQQHSPTLPAGAKGVKQRIKEVDSTDNTSQQEQKQQQQQQQHHSQQQEPVNADDAKSKQSGWTKYLRRHSKQLKIIVGGALTVVALYSFMNRKAISRALSA